jgi:general secretion pathway protein G
MARTTTPGEGRRLVSAGFTLIELITVVALIGILAAIALPNYRIAIIQSREAVLSENLFRMRDLIDQYYVDKGQYPPSIETLVEEGYLRKLPEDPFSRAADWTAVFAEPDPDRPGEPAGVYDVKSASELLSLAGTPYNEW